MISSSLVSDIHKYLVSCSQNLTFSSCGTLGHELKNDGTEITKLDLQIHEYLESILDANLLSEEGVHKLEFPTYVLDPIDGTRDLIKGLAECALSLAYLPSNKIAEGQGLIINPFTGLNIFSGSSFATSMTNPVSSSGPYLGLVSRTEFEKGLFSRFQNQQSQITIAPRGSVAFKLALLASGACDFVITLKPKSIWDIAAGTILCAQRGIRLYSKHGEINSFSDLRLSAPLFWCRQSLNKTIMENFADDF